MVLLRRLTAVATLLVTFLLVLTESGFACSGAAMPGMGLAASASSGNDMAGMGAMADHERAPDRAPDRAPCRFPWAPSGCRDMAPCAPAALAVLAALPAADAPPPDAVRAAPVTAPASIEAPPEPPPPRA
jgi:hypothetical protein